jgi:hypothetical protein
MEFDIRLLPEFAAWLGGLKDKIARERLLNDRFARDVAVLAITKRKAAASAHYEFIWEPVSQSITQSGSK